MKVKLTWHTAKYGDPYSEFVLCILPIQVHTHSREHTHTHTWTHTQSSGQPFMLRCPGSSWRFGALLKDTSIVERALYIHSLHRQSLPDRDSNSQPFDYVSGALPLGHDFPNGLMDSWWTVYRWIDRWEHKINLCWKRLLTLALGVFFIYTLT